MMGGSKRKSATPSCGEAGKITAEAFPSSKRKKALLALCARLLPDDMMLEVLLRLPVKSILRFRAVCRSWAALLSSKDFCSLHMATCKVLPPAPKLLVVSPTDDLLFTIDSARPDNVEVLTPSPCCGLTLLYDAAALAYYVCNAATRAVARLPPYCDRARDFTAGLGFDA
uniref:F-box domain-containing protein n=1 Tax=Triticum urartu TaxID=4572 RepID=A0A8R7P3L4_TRIUA